jgi:tryptophan synthase alpha chain
MTGIEHILAAFAQARHDSRAALITYLTLGYPDTRTTLQAIQSVAQSGADVIELGVPFSDPLADGPTIQYSTQVALNQHMTVKGALELADQARKAGVKQPMLFMGYVNPIFAYGVKAFVHDSAAAGMDGLIIPDLPPEEAEEIEAECKAHGLALVYLISPASPPERIQKVAERTSGFLYLVSLTGVTGARSQMPTDLPDFVARAKAAAHTPIAVGFGISTPAHAALVGSMADGVIVGSALINAMRTALQNGLDPVSAAGKFTAELRAGLNTRQATHAPLSG